MIVRRNRDAGSLEKIYHSVCWTAPLVVVVIVAATDNYANRGGYCYMIAGLPIFLSFFLPGLIIISANLVIFFFIAREIHDTLKSAPKADKQASSREVRVYFSIFASIGLSWILGFIMSFLEGVSRDIFLVLYSVSTPLQGFLIFISYCVNAKVTGKWMGLFGRVVPFFRRYENLGDSSATSSTSENTGTRSRSSQHTNSNNPRASTASGGTSEATSRDGERLSTISATSEV